MAHPRLTEIRNQKHRIYRRLKWRPGRHSKTIADADTVGWQEHNALVRKHLKSALECMDDALKACRTSNIRSTLDSVLCANRFINTACTHNTYGLIVISQRQRGLINRLYREL